MAAARKSTAADVVMLAWVKGAGWCGCYGVPAAHDAPAPAPVIHLLNVGDASIMAVRRVDKKIILPGGNGNGGAGRV